MEYNAVRYGTGSQCSTFEFLIHACDKVLVHASRLAARLDHVVNSVEAACQSHQLDHLTTFIQDV